MKSNSALKTAKLHPKEESASALRRPPVQSKLDEPAAEIPTAQGTRNGHGRCIGEIG